MSIAKEYAVEIAELNRKIAQLRRTVQERDAKLALQSNVTFTWR